jgi:hypothetical protein
MQPLAPKAPKHPIQAPPPVTTQAAAQAANAAEHPIAVHVEHPEAVMPLSNVFMRSAVLTFRITGWA